MQQHRHSDRGVVEQHCLTGFNIGGRAWLGLQGTVQLVGDEVTQRIVAKRVELVGWDQAQEPQSRRLGGSFLQRTEAIGLGDPVPKAAHFGVRRGASVADRTLRQHATEETTQTAPQTSSSSLSRMPLEKAPCAPPPWRARATPVRAPCDFAMAPKRSRGGRRMISGRTGTLRCRWVTDGPSPW